MAANTNTRDTLSYTFFLHISYPWFASLYVCYVNWYIFAVFHATYIHPLTSCPTFLLAAWSIESIVRPNKVTQSAISLLHQWQGGATRKSLSGILLAGVVVKDLQLNESSVMQWMTSPAAIHHLVCPQPLLYLSSIQQQWFRGHIHDRGTHATV